MGTHRKALMIKCRSMPEVALESNFLHDV